MLTQAQLKEYLHYNPDTGIFTWIKFHPKSRMTASKKIGGVFGFVDSRGYITGRLGGIHVATHRLAFIYMNGELPLQVDHINHVRNDNRWCNLRDVSGLTNHKNVSKQKNNTSGVCGVGWHKASSKWRAYIKINSKSISLGFFDNIDDAISSRESANIKYNFHENHGK